MHTAVKRHIFQLCRLTALTLGGWPSASRTLTLLWLLSPWHCHCKPFIPKALLACMDFISKNLFDRWKCLSLKFPGEADSPLVCSLLHQSPCLSVCVSVCSMSLLPLLCSKYSSFNEAKFFNYYFSLWNGSWSLGLLILSDWKGKKKSFKQFSDSL